MTPRRLLATDARPVPFALEASSPRMRFRAWFLQMRQALLLSALVVLATVPLAQASCHWCVDDVVADCTALDLADCQASADHLARHAPGRALEIADDPQGFACEAADEAELDDVC